MTGGVGRSRGRTLAAVRGSPGPLGGRPAAAGCLVGICALLAYLPGLGRPFGWDESVTIRNFVATPSLLDPLRRQVEYNNHPLLSLIDHLLYSSTGSTSEVLMRLAPLLAVVVAVGLFTTECTAWLGLVPGVTGGVLFAANPLVAEAARTSRGYGLVVLFTVVSSIQLIRLVRSEEQARWRSAVYVVAVALGVAAHLYMVLVVGAHVGYVVASRVPLRAWVARWAIGLASGGLWYIGLASTMLASPQRGSARPELLGDVTLGLLGGGVVALAIVPPLLSGLIGLRRDRAALAVIGVVGAIVTLDALVLHPSYLFARFFVWAVPGVALVAALGVAHVRVFVGAAGVACALMVAAVLPGYTQGDLGNKAAAADVLGAQRRGAAVCADSPVPLEAYLDVVPAKATADNLATCDVVVLLYEPSDYARQAVSEGRPFQLELGGRTPGIIYSRQPLAPGPAG